MASQGLIQSDKAIRLAASVCIELSEWNLDLGKQRRWGSKVRGKTGCVVVESTLDCQQCIQVPVQLRVVVVDSMLGKH